MYKSLPKFLREQGTYFSWPGCIIKWFADQVNDRYIIPFPLIIGSRLQSLILTLFQLVETTAGPSTVIRFQPPSIVRPFDFSRMTKGFDIVKWTYTYFVKIVTPGPKRICSGGFGLKKNNKLRYLKFGINHWFNHSLPSFFLKWWPQSPKYPSTQWMNCFFHHRFLHQKA